MEMEVMNNNSRYSPSHLDTKNVTQLMDEVFEPKTVIIEGLLYEGTYLYTGAPKIGKSFMMAEFGYHVSMGVPLWNHNVKKAGVLYLALEDDYKRLQQRIATMYGVEDNHDFHLAIKAENIEGGLLDQIKNFLAEHPETKLVIVDTLQKIREDTADNGNYKSDYEVVSKLKRISDENNICILVVHHTRKMGAEDKFDMISGTNGLLGSADGAFIMTRAHDKDTAEINITGRDVPTQKLIVKFDQNKCIWELVKQESGIMKREPDPILIAVNEFFSDGKESWEGTASELMDLLQISGMNPNALSRQLNVLNGDLINEFGIRFNRIRTKTKRIITLTKLNESG